MPELSPELFQLARPLFAHMETSHALATAVFDTGLPARIFADDISAPKTAVMAYNSRILCAGHAEIPAEMADWFNNELIPAHRAAGNDAYLFCFVEDGWKMALEGAFSAYKIYHGERQYYEISDFRPESLPPLPEGFSMQLVSPEFLASGLGGVETIREEMCSERVSVEDFLAHSFGLCPVYENEVAGWCMSEYNVGARCEIGIATAEKHQRKGLATLSTRYFLAEAHRRGYKRVGWDCWKRNEASAATALKAGLTFVEEYPALVVVFEPR
jgi:RimJ/RimL family protein N-acetyltransferase